MSGFSRRFAAAEGSGGEGALEGRAKAGPGPEGPAGGLEPCWAAAPSAHAVVAP